MAVRVQCTSCKQMVSILKLKPGQVYRCPRCAQPLDVVAAAPGASLPQPTSRYPAPLPQPAPAWNPMDEAIPPSASEIPGWDVAMIPSPPAPSRPTPRARQPKRKSGGNLLSVVVVLLILGGAGAGFWYMLDQHKKARTVATDDWELRNKSLLLRMKEEAQTLARDKQLEMAFAKYEAIADLLGGHGLTDPELIALSREVLNAQYALKDQIVDQRNQDARRTAATRRSPATRRAPVPNPPTVVENPPTTSPPTTSPSTQPAVVTTATTQPAVGTSDPATRPQSVASNDPMTRPAAQTRPASEVVLAPATQPVAASPPATAPVATQSQPATAPVVVIRPPAATMPASRPVDDPAQLSRTFNKLLEQGTNALAAGAPQAGIEALMDAKLIFDRCLRAKTLSVGCPEQVAMLHGIAMASQLLGRNDRASVLFDNGQPLDRAINSKSASRQLLLTRAAVDVVQGVYVMRTVIRLSEYLNDHPDDIDSEILDVFFSAIVKAEDRTSNQQVLAPHMRRYEDFNARLEGLHPGDRRWGVQWIPAAEFSVKMRERQAALQEWYRACDATNLAVREVKAAGARYAQLKNNFRSSPAQVGAAQRAMEDAKSRAYAANDEAKALRAKVPPVPVLADIDYKRLLLPRDVTIASRDGTRPDSAGAPAPDTTAVALNKPRVISAGMFNLGGSEQTPTPTGTPPAGDTTSATTRPDSGFTAPVAGAAKQRSYTRTCAGFAVAPDLILTSASTIHQATRLTLEFPDAQSIDATVVRAEGPLALVKVPGQQFAYLNLAPGFTGGAVQCRGFPEVSLFNASIELMQGGSRLEGDQLILSLSRHPRLPGTPVIDGAGRLVAMTIAERTDPIDKLPAVSLEKLRAFLGADAPTQSCGNPAMTPIVQITASFER